VRFLLDQNISPDLARALTNLGHDAVHVRDLGMSRASDIQILEQAQLDQRVIPSSDTDFGGLLARGPCAHRRPTQHRHRSSSVGSRIDAQRKLHTSSRRISTPSRPTSQQEPSWSSRRNE
jgi:hypothetical protein